MAEGGMYNSSDRGSDVCFEYTCTPCADEGDNQEALKYCLKCREYLCATCVKHHRKFAATKKHTLHDKGYKSNESDSTTTLSDDDEMFKCVYHPDRNIEMYCGAHEMVFCAYCIAKEHRHCREILELEEAAGKIHVNKKGATLSKIRSLLNDVEATRKAKSTLISLDHEKKDILKTIEDTEHLLIEKVKELASDAKTKTCIRYDDLKNECHVEDSLLLETLTNTTELKNEVESQEELDEKRQFARYIRQNRKIAQAHRVHENVKKNEKKMKCFKNDELIHQVSSADCLVQIVGSKSSLNKDKPMRKSSQREVTIKDNGDKETCSIYGIIQLHDGTIILADCTNNKLKKLSKDYRITDKLKLESNPMGICLTGKNEIAVKLKNDTLQFISVKDKFTKMQSVDIEGGDHIGLVSTCNEIWSYTGNGINVYNRAGIVMKSFDRKSFERKTPLKNGKCIPVADDEGFIYISDLDKRVACLDRKGNVWTVMKIQQMERVRRACVAQNGIMFLAGYSSGNIMMFNGKGKCLGELVNGLENPDSLCYDDKTRELIIGHKNKNTLTIIKTDECL